MIVYENTDFFHLELRKLTHKNKNTKSETMKLAGDQPLPQRPRSPER